MEVVGDSFWAIGVVILVTPGQGTPGEPEFPEAGKPPGRQGRGGALRESSKELRFLRT